MSIPSAKYLKNKAKNRLADGKEPKKVVLCYAGIVAGSTLLVRIIRDLLDMQISQSGGLQNINARSMLTTADTVITIAQLLLIACVSLGYTAAMLRIARRQYASPATLKAGLERIWVLVRTRLLEMLILSAASFALCLLVVNICMLTPLANPLLRAMAPLANSGALTPEAMLSDAATLSVLYSATMPIMLIYLAALVPLVWYFMCTYRMTDYLLIDRPQLGAFGALRESRRMMKGNIKMMLRLDLSFWWYYLLQAAVTALTYLSVLLALFGISLPLPTSVIYYGTVVLYLAADAAVRYFFSNQVAVSYALFYDSLCPKQEPPAEGAVLGNIFQM